MESLNRMAIELVDEVLDFADELGVVVYELDSGATVIDCGVDAEAGLEAGLLLAEVQTAGLATVQTRMDEVAGAPIPHVELTTDHPALALLCSQKAGWELAFEGQGEEPGFDGLGAGPARALVGQESEFQAVGYYDEFDLTVLTVESIDLPDDAVAEHVSELTGVEPSGVFLPTFATGSTVGSVTMAARAAELAVFRLFELGYDPKDVLTASGSAPVAPVSYDEGVAMGRTNDALAYGGQVYVQVREDSDVFDALPSTAAEEYGTPFETVFEEADWDFYEVSDSVFAPAQVTVDVVDGPTRVLGETDEELLAESFGFQ
ncbi:methenyltetrahydromethanopterin cyclohydrolase [Salinigranum rubrum]|uniref:Methenyltetrahydromethanopterin cyclohydrolase n=1 Tax=Salinigranum rubrum TaxID=755307 RepID=A0A2I8VLY2_9EURY|nr:methenyltetrahydromethanopterin cyclohydrolase [Salinigranum rubrum]AUV82942.1 methenyltetrahydromethanopterin cyclohydrolase [Salinigranum rubrum]